MDYKKKITFLLLAGIAVLFAEDITERSVYFSPDTPHITELSRLLEQHEYVFTTDSLSARYKGELFYYMEKDSIRCEVQITHPNGLPFILGAFMTEPAASRNVQSALLKFSIWMLILNAVTAILFFVRSS
jgi:hypothetical protein